MSEFLSKTEQNKETEIDLTNLSIVFDSNENIENLIRNRKIEPYEEWLEKNEKDLKEK